MRPYSSSPLTRLSASAVLIAAMSLGSLPASGQTVFVNQGADWTPERRQAFYTQDQGSRMMPLAWMRSLKQPNGEGFLSDGLARYGYLPNPVGSGTDLPVGFTVADSPDGEAIGMTCSACHTRQIEVGGTSYRIDGGPAIVDFQGFLKDTSDAVEAVLATPAAFDAFADSVLGSGADNTKKQELKLAVEVWQLRFGTLIERSLPDPAWGPSRVDAISMIFNRVAGLDLGEPPTYLIPDNIAKADAPTRYPFLWNAARQDKTQWPGFADNGNAILGLARNLGEVYGVSALFHPVKQNGLLNRDYITNNSANFPGLNALEDLIWKIGPPTWPWGLDHTLVAEGRAIYNRDTDQGGCVDCHGIKTGAFRSFKHRTWRTPILDVGTDSRECAVLARTVQTGVMEGAKIKIPPVLDFEVKAEDTAFNVLRVSVLGAIIQNTLRLGGTAETMAEAVNAEPPTLPAEFDYLPGAFRDPDELETMDLEGLIEVPGDKSGCAYEARVLRGIWAAAPYLHNGSIRSLEDLLKPAAERAPSFRLGPNYDIEAVGLAVDQTRFDYTLETTDCSAVDSGNSRCGHEYGTTLSESEKAALLEYLKAL